jgi:predicted nucleic acid-binding protein
MGWAGTGVTQVKLADALHGVSLLSLDTTPIIYFMERNPAYVSLVRETLRRVVQGDFKAMTSVVTLTEVLTLPRRVGDTASETAYQNFLLQGRNLTLTTIDTVVADRAATLRANYGLRTPDALQIAAALTAGADAFLTNDSGLRRVTELRVLILNDMEL